MTKASVTVSTLKDIINQDRGCMRGGLVNLQSGSKQLPVQVSTPRIKPKKAKFSHQDLIHLQTAQSMSDKSIKVIARAVRSVFKRHSFKPCLSQALTVRNQWLNDMFMVKNFPMELKRKRDDSDEPILKERCAVVCKDVNQLIHLIIEYRNMDP